MNKADAFISLVSLSIDDSSTMSLFRQIYETLRGTILSGRLMAGTRLPSSRTLATALNVSRNTVSSAYDQLKLDGFLEGHTGAGTFVTRSLPSLANNTRSNRYEKSGTRARQTSDHARLSDRGAKITDLWTAIDRDHYRSNAFRPRLPAHDSFPLDVWSRLTARRWKQMPSEILTYGDPAGYLPLREIVASYLNDARDVQCEAGQVIIVSGTPQAISLATAVLLNQGDAVWLEDPGYPRARATFMAADALVVPVPMDADGINIKEGIKREPNAKMVYVTPSHQYPLGMKMSLTRRMELLQWANKSQAWILEDDYGTEFRTGLPLAALQGFGDAGRTLYMGSFSNILSPVLNLGYLVVPSDLVDAFVSARVLRDRCPPLFGQVVLADFIADNHFDRHLRKLRSLYETRHSALKAALSARFGGFLDVLSDESGMQLVALLRHGMDDKMLSRQIAEQDIEAPPLSFYSIDPPDRGGFVLGYAAVNEKNIDIGVRRMRRALDGVMV
jgi:GntR family transcriptional regulator / MocR family aminotransferase